MSITVNFLDNSSYILIDLYMTYNWEKIIFLKKTFRLICQFITLVT